MKNRIASVLIAASMGTAMLFSSMPVHAQEIHVTSTYKVISHTGDGVDDEIWEEFTKIWGTDLPDDAPTGDPIDYGGCRVLQEGETIEWYNGIPGCVGPTNESSSQDSSQQSSSQDNSQQSSSQDNSQQSSSQDSSQQSSSQDSSQQSSSQDSSQQSSSQDSSQQSSSQDSSRQSSSQDNSQQSSSSQSSASTSTPTPATSTATSAKLATGVKITDKEVLKNFPFGAMTVTSPAGVVFTEGVGADGFSYNVFIGTNLANQALILNTAGLPVKISSPELINVDGKMYINVQAVNAASVYATNEQKHAFALFGISGFAANGKVFETFQ